MDATPGRAGPDLTGWAPRARIRQMAARLTSIIVIVIVAATIIAGLIAGAQRDDSGPVDLIVLNGKVYTADGNGRFEEALAVRGNQIVRVGTNRDIKRLRRPQTQVIDAHGGAVLPGFNDAHAQLLGRTPFAASEVNLTGAATLEQIQQTLRAAAEGEPGRTWIVGHGWTYDAFPNGVPTRQQLDAAISDRPAYFTSRDGHAGWANSRALALAGITRRSTAPLNGMIVTDPRTGTPTGLLKEDAQELIEHLLSPVSREDRLHALREALADATRMGITSIQTAGNSAGDLDLYDELRHEGDLTVRVYAVVSSQDEPTAARLAALDRVRLQYPDDPLLKAGAVALTVDGSIESQTALLLQPYAGRKGNGRARYTLESLQRTIAALDGRGWQIVMQATGDGAVRLALDAYSRALATPPSSGRPRRHRLSGLEMIDPADLQRLVESQLIAEQAPMRAMLAGRESGVWSLNLGSERANRGWAWHLLAQQGVTVIFGSDSPTTPEDPLMGLYAVANGVAPEAADPTPRLAEPDMPLEKAIDAYTRNAAFASFDEQRKGLLARGMLADVVVLSTDIFSLPPERLLDGHVDVTIFDGKVVFQRQGTPIGTH